VSQCWYSYNCLHFLKCAECHYCCYLVKFIVAFSQMTMSTDFPRCDSRSVRIQSRLPFLRRRSVFVRQLAEFETAGARKIRQAGPEFEPGRPKLSAPGILQQTAEEGRQVVEGCDRPGTNVIKLFTAVSKSVLLCRTFTAFTVCNLQI
jgi:hypothetical protein